MRYGFSYDLVRNISRNSWTVVDSYQVKALITPTINLLDVIEKKYNKIDDKSAGLIFELTDIASICYVFMGVSTAQSMELFEKMKQGVISAPAMDAVNKSFKLYYEQVNAYLSACNLLLVQNGYTYKKATKFHKDSWKRAKERRPIEMEKLESIRESDVWSWIDENSWQELIDLDEKAWQDAIHKKN